MSPSPLPRLVPGTMPIAREILKNQRLYFMSNLICLEDGGVELLPVPITSIVIPSAMAAGARDLVRIAPRSGRAPVRSTHFVKATRRGEARLGSEASAPRLLWQAPCSPAVCSFRSHQAKPKETAFFFFFLKKNCLGSGAVSFFHFSKSSVG